MSISFIRGNDGEVLYLYNMLFEDFKLNKQILNAVADAGYVHATPIQERAIPRVLSGHDVLGIAQTGTGKTAAYVLPILKKLGYAQGEDPRCVIIVPTRELVLQVVEVIESFTSYMDIRAVGVYGGTSLKTQAKTVLEGCDIIVATPGRLMDIYKMQAILFKDVKTVILDEVDRMLEMGFSHQIQNLITLFPVKRQNLFFSATFPDKCQRIAEDFLEFPEKIEISPEQITAETVNQIIYHVPNFLTKINMLGVLLEDTERFNRVIIFSRTKAHAENISKYLERTFKEEVKTVHSNKGQNTRLNSIEAFREGEARFLVATDVASRGLDVSMVTHVINFDVPLVYNDYIHRVGRTGRAQEQGEAITFVNDAEKWHVKKIEKLIAMKIPVWSLPEACLVHETPFEENQIILREIDGQRRKEDPEYKGAFHDKKKGSNKRYYKPNYKKGVVPKKKKGGGKKKR